MVKYIIWGWILLLFVFCFAFGEENSQPEKRQLMFGIKSKPQQSQTTRYGDETPESPRRNILSNLLSRSSRPNPNSSPPPGGKTFTDRLKEKHAALNGGLSPRNDAYKAAVTNEGIDPNIHEGTPIRSPRTEHQDSEGFVRNFLRSTGPKRTRETSTPAVPFSRGHTNRHTVAHSRIPNTPPHTDQDDLRVQLLQAQWRAEQAKAFIEKLTEGRSSGHYVLVLDYDRTMISTHTKGRHIPFTSTGVERPVPKLTKDMEALLDAVLLKQKNMEFNNNFKLTVFVATFSDQSLVPNYVYAGEKLVRATLGKRGNEVTFVYAFYPRDDNRELIEPETKTDKNQHLQRLIDDYFDECDVHLLDKNIVLVDDQIRNVRAAVRGGMRGVYVDGENGFDFSAIEWITMEDVKREDMKGKSRVRLH